MLGRQSGQIDIFTSMIYCKLIPKDHLLVKIDNTVDFSFVYDIVKNSYSETGRESIDPVMMYKLCLLEYLYKLSYRQVVERALTDIAFRWFLRLNLDDKVPDDTTDVAANVNYPTDKRMLCDAYRKTIREISKSDYS